MWGSAAELVEKCLKHLLYQERGGRMGEGGAGDARKERERVEGRDKSETLEIFPGDNSS